MISIGDYEYRETDILGEGGFGKAYRGRNVKTGQQVAIKVILKCTLKKYQQREIENLKGLNCRNVVQLLDYSINSGNVYLTMELCTEDMECRIQNIGRDFLETEIRNFIRQTATGLSYIHGKNIVHRDIKPANILYVIESNEFIYKLSDFGISKMIKATQQMTDIGSERYIAPEIRNKLPASFNADIWSLGVTVCYMITNNLRNLKYKNKVSRNLEDLLDKMLVIEPHDRLNADDVLDHIFIENV